MEVSAARYWLRSPVAMELVWHKQRPLGKAATWLRERICAQPLPNAPQRGA